jgi:hypothetical protein
MPAILPETSEFRTAVYGTVFAKRSVAVRRLAPGDPLLLVPDPPGVDDPSVWVHARGGDVVGHLSPDLSAWLVPWLLAGHRCCAAVGHVGGPDVASWKRLVIEVRCWRRETTFEAGPAGSKF